DQNEDPWRSDWKGRPRHGRPRSSVVPYRGRQNPRKERCLLRVPGPGWLVSVLAKAAPVSTGSSAATASTQPRRRRGPGWRQSPVAQLGGCLLVVLQRPQNRGRRGPSPVVARAQRSIDRDRAQASDRVQ